MESENSRLLNLLVRSTVYAVAGGVCCAQVTLQVAGLTSRALKYGDYDLPPHALACIAFFLAAFSFFRTGWNAPCEAPVTPLLQTLPPAILGTVASLAVTVPTLIICSWLAWQSYSATKETFLLEFAHASCSLILLAGLLAGTRLGAVARRQPSLTRMQYGLGFTVLLASFLAMALSVLYGIQVKLAGGYEALNTAPPIGSAAFIGTCLSGILAAGFIGMWVPEEDQHRGWLIFSSGSVLGLMAGWTAHWTLLLHGYRRQAINAPLFVGRGSESLLTAYLVAGMLAGTIVSLSIFILGSKFRRTLTVSRAKSNSTL